MFGPKLFYSIFIRSVCLHSISCFVCLFSSFLCIVVILCVSVFMFVFPVCASCLVMFVFLLKPRKQQEAVNNVNNVKFCFCLQMVEYLVFYQSQESNRRWSNRSAAVTDRLRLQPFWGLKHFSTNSKANASIFAMFAWLAMFAIFAIFSIFHNICNICDICKICNFQILNHLKPYTGFWSTQYICIPVRSQMTVFIISLSGVAIEFDLE